VQSYKKAVEKPNFSLNISVSCFLFVLLHPQTAGVLAARAGIDGSAVLVNPL
jgi:hypothetical protein